MEHSERTGLNKLSKRLNHPKLVSLDAKSLEKPFLTLRKLGKKISKVPTQEEVHDIRTNARRIEAILQALRLDRSHKGRRVLRAVTPMRKKAGDVRDMDVLTGFSARLSASGEEQCLVKLLEHLGQVRGRSARTLRQTVTKHRKAASRSLKNCVSLIKKNFAQRSSAKLKEWSVYATADTLRISEELSNWPTLSSKNIHPFRLKVKEMKYVLQLSGTENDLAERLGQVKDQIGEWHDWTELQAIAKKVLSDCKDCEVIHQIEQMDKNKFESALKVAQHLRRKYFQAKSTIERNTNTFLTK